MRVPHAYAAFNFIHMFTLSLQCQLGNLLPDFSGCILYLRRVVCVCMYCGVFIISQACCLGMCVLHTCAVFLFKSGVFGYARTAYMYSVFFLLFAHVNLYYVLLIFTMHSCSLHYNQVSRLHLHHYVEDVDLVMFEDFITSLQSKLLLIIFLIHYNFLLLATRCTITSNIMGGRI